MLLRNKKGFSLIELLIVLAIVGLMAPLLFIVLISGIEDYSTTTKYIDQQYTVMEVTRLIRQDVEEAKKITFTSSGSVKFEFPSATPARPAKEWSFGTDSGKDGLLLNGSMVIESLDLSNSKFTVDNISNPTRLILIIKPDELNKTKYKGRNVNENIITEFSVRYKIIG